MRAIWENENKSGLVMDTQLLPEKLSFDNSQELTAIYKAVRRDSEKICKP